MANGGSASPEAYKAGLECMARLDPIFEQFAADHGMAIWVDQKYGWPVRAFRWEDAILRRISITMQQGSSGTFTLFAFATVKGYERECHKSEDIFTNLVPEQFESDVLEHLNNAKNVVDSWTLEGVRNSKRP